MSKISGILAVIKSSNYVIITDTTNIGKVNPIYVNDFIEEIDKSREELRLLSIRHERLLQKIADRPDSIL